MYFDVLSLLSAESQILYYVRLYVFPFQCCMLIPACGTSFIRTCLVFQCICTLLFMIIYILSLPRHISPLCTYSDFSIVISFPLYILSLSSFHICLTCHWLRQLNKPMANGWYMASLTLWGLYPDHGWYTDSRGVTVGIRALGFILPRVTLCLVVEPV
jgi:hypothetical protein